MDDLIEIHLKRLQHELGSIARELTRWHQPSFSTRDLWRPSLNAYRCGRQFVICLELAGVDAGRLRVQAEARRLVIEGHRRPPEPPCVPKEATHVLAMEIDYGPFRRELALPEEIDPSGVKAEHQGGLLWVYLPLLTSSPPHLGEGKEGS